MIYQNKVQILKMNKRDQKVERLTQENEADELERSLYSPEWIITSPYSANEEVKNSTR